MCVCVQNIYIIYLLYMIIYYILYIIYCILYVILTEMNNAFDELISILDMVEVRTSELEESSIEIFQTEMK